MAKLRPVHHPDIEAPIGYSFDCPGCKQDHTVYVRHNPAIKHEHYVWSFNGNLERPTFCPSLLVEWEEWDEEKKATTQGVCHSFICNGIIEFLNDCTPGLRNKFVELEDIEMYEYNVYDGRFFARPERAEVLECLGDQPSDEAAIKAAQGWRGVDAYVTKFVNGKDVFVHWLFEQGQEVK